MATDAKNKKFPWQLEVETKLNSCVGSHDPKKFQAATMYLLQEANKEVGSCIGEKKFKCAKRLCNTLRVFLAHIHLKRKFMTVEVSHPSIYDVTLAILSLLLDLQLFLSRKPKNSSLTEEIRNQIVEDILLFAGTGRQDLWDVLLQSSEVKNKRFRNISGPVFERIIGASPWNRVQEPEAFLKCLLCLRLWYINCVPAERSKVQKITSSLPVPCQLSGWLKAHPIVGLPLLAKKENPKTFLETFVKKLEQSVADQLCGALSEELTVPDNNENCEPDGSIADILKEPSVGDTTAKELFVLDTSGSKNPLMSSGLEDQETDDLLQQIHVDLQEVPEIPEEECSSKRKLEPNSDEVSLLSEDEVEDLQQASDFVSIEQTPVNEVHQEANEVERSKKNLQETSTKSKKSRKKRRVANELDDASAVSENVLQGDEAAEISEKPSAHSIALHQKATLGTEVTSTSKSETKKLKSRRSVKKNLLVDLDEKLPLPSAEKADTVESSKESAANLDPVDYEENICQIGDSNNNLSPIKSNLQKSSTEIPETLDDSQNFHPGDDLTSDSDNTPFIEKSTLEKEHVKNMDMLDNPMASDDDKKLKICNINIPSDMEVEELRKPLETSSTKDDSPFKETRKLFNEKSDNDLESEIDVEKDINLQKTIQTSPNKSNLGIVDKTATTSPHTELSQICDPLTDFQSQYSNFFNVPTQKFVPSNIHDLDNDQISSENSNLDLEEIALDVSCQTHLTSDEDAEKEISVCPARVEKMIKKEMKESEKETDLTSDEDAERENPVIFSPSQVEKEREKLEMEDSNHELDDTEIYPTNASQDLFVTQQEKVHNKITYIDSDSSEEFLSPKSSPDPSLRKSFQMKSPRVGSSPAKGTQNSEAVSPSKLSPSQRSPEKTPTKNCTVALVNISAEKAASNPNDTISCSVPSISRDTDLCSERACSPDKSNSPKKSTPLCINISETDDMDVQSMDVDAFPDVQNKSTEVEEFSHCPKSDFSSKKSNSLCEDSDYISKTGDIESMDIDAVPENCMEVDTISRKGHVSSEVTFLNMKNPETPERQRTFVSQNSLRSLRTRKYCTSDKSIVEVLDGSEVSDTLISEIDSPVLIGHTTPTKDSLSKSSPSLKSKLCSPRDNSKEKSVDVDDECVSLNIPTKIRKLSPIKTPSKLLEDPESPAQSDESFDNSSPKIVLEKITFENAETTTDKLQSPLNIQEEDTRDNIPNSYSLRTRKTDSTPVKKLQVLKKSSASETSQSPSKNYEKCKSPSNIEKQDKNGLFEESTTLQSIKEWTTPIQQSSASENSDSSQKNNAPRSENDSSVTLDDVERRYNTRKLSPVKVSPKKLSPMKLSPLKSSDNESHDNTRNLSPKKPSPAKSSDNESHYNTRNLSPRIPSAKSSENESLCNTRNLSPTKPSPAKNSNNENHYTIKTLSPMKPFSSVSSDNAPHYNTRTKSPMKTSSDISDSAVVHLQHGFHNPVKINEDIPSPVKRDLEIKSMQSINTQADLYLGDIQDPVEKSPLKIIKKLKYSRLIPTVHLVPVKEGISTRMQTRTEPVAKLLSSPNPAKEKLAGETLAGPNSKAVSCHDDLSLHVSDADDVVSVVSSTDTLLNISLQKSNQKSHAATNIKSDMLSERKDSLSSFKRVGPGNVKSNSEIPTKSSSKKLSYSDDSELSDASSESSDSSSTVSSVPSCRDKLLLDVDDTVSEIKSSASTDSSTSTKVSFQLVEKKQTFSSAKKDVSRKASGTLKPSRNTISETDSDDTNASSRKKEKQTSPTLEQTILTDESNLSSSLLADDALSTPAAKAFVRVTPTAEASVQTVLRSRHIAMLTPPISSRRILRNRTISRSTAVKKAKLMTETPRSSKTSKPRSMQSKMKSEVSPSSQKDNPGSSPGPSKTVATPSGARMSPRRSKLYSFRPRMKTPKV